MKNNKIIYYWIEFGILVIGITYTINLHLFKQSIKKISEKHYDNMFEKAYTIIQIPGYSFYLYAGFTVLALLIAYSIYYVIKNKEHFFEELINYLIILANVILVIITAYVFYDPIFTTALIMFGVVGGAIGIFSEYK